MSITLEFLPGSIIKRNYRPGFDSTDPAFDFIQGITFRVIEVPPAGYIPVEIVEASSDYGRVGDKMTIPGKYLSDYFFEVIS